MRILVHDFGGYPYPLELSQALARRGHHVCHAYCASLQTTPPGTAGAEGPVEGLDVQPLHLRAPLDKFDFVKRWRQEHEYGRLAADAVDRFEPDVVLSANMPLDAQHHLLRRSRTHGARFVFWVQDLIGVAAHRLLRRKLPVAGEVIGRLYLRREQRQLRASDAVVPLTEDFVPLFERWGVPSERVHVIENWAPLGALPVRPKGTAWTRAHGLAETFNFVYAGTLGMKHNPDLLLQLALRFRDRPEVRVVVLSQGPGADWLRAQRETHRLEHLVVRGFEPFRAMPDVMGAADVLVGVLEADAGIFSVPSKVLAYLCAARPLLLAMPRENLAARIVDREGAGCVVGPTDTEGFLRSAEQLLGDAAARAAQGANARRYAERSFDIEAITDRFEAVLCPG